MHLPQIHLPKINFEDGKCVKTSKFTNNNEELLRKRSMDLLLEKGREINLMKDPYELHLLKIKME